MNEFIRSPKSSKSKLLANINRGLKLTANGKGLKELNILINWKNSIQLMLNQVSEDNPAKLSDLKRKQFPMSMNDDMQRVNPYLKDDQSFTINCAYCSAAYDLRRRGFDVEADDYHNNADIDSSINSIFEIYSWWTHKNTVPFYSNKELKQKRFDELYPGYRFMSASDYSCSDIEAELISQGNNARGQISLMWTFGGAHSLIYEVLNGKVILRDCQHSKIRHLGEYYGYLDRLYYFRTDNEEPTERILKCVKNKLFDTTCPKDNDYALLSLDSLASQFRINNFAVTRYKTFIKVHLKQNSLCYLLIYQNGSIKYINAIEHERKSSWKNTRK